MKCIIGKLNVAKEILEFVSSTNKLSVKTHHKLHKLLPLLEEEVKFYNDKYQEFLEKYSEKNEDGSLKLIEGTNNVKIVEGKEEEAFKEREELFNLEVELPDTKFDISDFGDLEMSAYEFDCIISFIE